MRKTAISIALATALGANPAQAVVTITWDAAAVQETTFTVPHAANGGTTSAYTLGFSAGGALPGFEFRMIVPGGSVVGGGTPGGGFSGNEKDAMFGTESWSFSAGGLFTGVAGVTAAATNPGAVASAPLAGASACPTSGLCPTLQEDALFFGAPFNFLAPVSGGLAAAAYGAGSISLGAPGVNAFTITMPVLEAQWSTKPFKLGLSTGGITFDCTGAVSGNVACHAEHLITGAEEQGFAFQGWTAQWDLHGVMSPANTAPTTTTTTAPTTTTTTTTAGATTTTAPPPPTTTTTTAGATTTTAGGTTTTAGGTTTTAGATTTTAPPVATTTTTAAPVATTTTTAAPVATTTTAPPVTTTTTTLPPQDPNVASIITVVQNGQTRSELVIGEGDATATSNSASSTCDWTNTDNEIAISDPFVNPATIPGASLQETSAATLRVTCSPEGEKIIRIVSVAGPGGSEDANNNGLGDGLEPTGLAGNQIPVDGTDPSAGIVESSPGTQLEMGETAFEANNPGVGVSLADIAASGGGGGIGTDSGVKTSCVGSCFSFKVTGISPVGSSVRITLPLSAPIPASAVYRKFFPDFGWLDFDTSQGDTTESANKDAGGNCPSPGSPSYTGGLTAGDNCVQLKIKDGGPNDTDGAVNGVATDPGGVANTDTTPPVITLNPPVPQTVQFSKTAAYTDPGFTAMDDVDGDITDQVIVTGTIDRSQRGDRGLQYDVTDAAGNQAQTVTRNVFVTTNAGGGGSKNRLGCAVSPLQVSPAARGDWWLLGGFIAWLGTVVRRRRRS